ncbi:hypothetical protein K0M31_001937 [Melipona bicolor]|uniref:Uncharacterized protein n=1 Tax=Melipona bicolor TaxID=60889 RepID=A0AA40GGJ5_9HYME|nr:hypothetical protein K0M31_001937 [Melipona bicolor]
MSLEIAPHHPNTCSVRNLGKPAEHRLGSKLCRPSQLETRMQNQSFRLATDKSTKRKAAVKRPWKYNKGGPSKQHPANYNHGRSTRSAHAPLWLSGILDWQRFLSHIEFRTSRTGSTTF